MHPCPSSGPVSQRILGIDPGLRITGFGLIEMRGAQLDYVASGCIKTQEGRRSGHEDLPNRLRLILEGIAEVVATYQPTHAAVEKVFVNVNPQSTLLLGQARGAAISALVLAGLPVAEYTALQLKQAVVGHGKAAKQQVSRMVCELLRLDGAPAADAADALACAICHAHSGHGLGAQLQQLGLSHARRRRGRLL